MSIQLKKIAGKSLFNTTNDEETIFGEYHIIIDNKHSLSFDYYDLIPLHLAENQIEKRI